MKPPAVAASIARHRSILHGNGEVGRGFPCGEGSRGHTEQNWEKDGSV